MHKTGPGLMGALVLGLILSPLATAADQTQSGAAGSTATQSSSDSSSADQSSAAQPPVTPNVTDTTTPQQPATGQNSASAPTPPVADTTPAQPAAPANTAPAQPSAPANNPSATATATAPAPAKPAPAKRPVGEKSAAAKSAAAKTTAADKAKMVAAAKSSPVSTFKVASCPDLNATQVAELIQQDYIQNRFPHFDDDKLVLGGDTIVALVNPEEVMGTGDSWQAPLKIRGAAADLSYGVSLDCQKGEMTYSRNK